MCGSTLLGAYFSTFFKCRCCVDVHLVNYNNTTVYRWYVVLDHGLCVVLTPYILQKII